MKIIIPYLLAFIPGAPAYMNSNSKKAWLTFLSIFIAAYLYRLSGVLGPTALFVSLLGVIAFYLIIVLLQIKHTKPASSYNELAKGIVFFTVVSFGTKINFEPLALGNIYLMSSSDSMSRIIPPGDSVYVSKIPQEYKTGDIVVYKFNGSTFLGIVCGVPGDTVSIEGRNILLNQKKSECGVNGFTRSYEMKMDEVKIPDNSYFIVTRDGLDNTLTQKASSKDAIKGKVLFNTNEMPQAGWVKNFYKFVEAI